jgi:hypothetical protein
MRLPAAIAVPSAVAQAGSYGQPKVGSMAKKRYGKTLTKAIAEIRAFREMGLWSLEDFPGKFSGGKGMAQAKKLGVTSEQLAKGRSFAKESSEADLSRLCGEIEAGGFPVAPQHIVRLLRLPSNRRWKFLRETIQNRWSCRDLTAAIQRAMGGRRRAGRTPRVTDRREAIQKLLVLCEQWQRLRAVLGQDETGDGTITEMLPRSLNAPIRQCDQAMAKLYGALGRFRKF